MQKRIVERNKKMNSIEYNGEELYIKENLIIDEA